MREEKYLNVDLNDPRSAAIAEVMTNKTCKKILDLIAEKEMSESDISSLLNIPLNTVGYNIKKLLDAGLIEKCKNFFWSVKGKKIPTYKLSNKKIIISPRRLVSAAPLALFVAVLGAILIIALLGSQERIENLNSDSNMKQFNSYKELEKFVNEREEAARNIGGYYGTAETFAGGVGTEVAKASASSVYSDSETGTADYSKTNIQVEGVDEPDFVKNDGKYIYLLNGKKLLIIDAYPAERMNLVGEIDFNDSINIRDIFVNGDKLIVFGNTYKYMSYLPEYAETKDKVASSGMVAPCIGRECGGYSEEKTIIYVYDISDRSGPELEKNISIKGNYIDSRMIGDYVYAISSQYIYGGRDIYPVLEINGVEKTVPIGDVYYNDINDGQFVFTNVVAMDIESGDVSNKVYLTGATGTIYVSQNNVYLTSLKRASYNDYNKRIVEDVILPLLPLEEKEKVVEIMKSSESDYGKFNLAMKITKDYSDSLSGEDKNAFDQRLQKELEAFKLRIGKESEKTVIHKINIDKERITYEGVGEVFGHVLNQFSMDEFDGNFRIATTTGEVWSGNSLNHLFVLDKNMKNVGSVEDLAPGEKIYSVRFMGNRAYIVTFKKIDPFYVVDLSDGGNPRVLGYLKIPGYSDYLHPYDENYIIGIGKNARGGGENFAWYQGIKISLFDVSDVENPQEAAKFDIGDRGTDSYALQDHKAFLFDKERKLLVLPILLAEINQNKYNQQGWKETPEDARYGDVIWQGAYVLNIDNDEISLRGKISHFNDSEKKNGPAKDEPIGAERKDWQGNVWVKQGEDVWKTNASGYENTGWGNYMIDSLPGGFSYQRNWYDDRFSIKRSLYMDDVLYTVSSGKVKANNLQSVEEIKSVEMPYDDYTDRVVIY
ncbi:beta-propeller domain-containing protein [Candidatus Pacearchaeota archaeon]|nr:beta-propeller domain-containing protein [Candidatus Pacearchaeota archaeon]